MRQAAKGAVLVASVFAVTFGWSSAGRPQQGDTPPANSAGCAQCAPILDMLRQAGASPSELAEFESSISKAPPTTLAAFEEQLRQQSAGQRANFVTTLRLDRQYIPGPDSLPQPGVPTGKIFEFTFDRSQVFPGTTRRISVYVPAQYKADKPACVYVGFDSLGFKAPVVFDNLIHKGEMPLTIAIGVPPGVVETPQPQNPRFNRSNEFDGLSGDLGSFLLDEILPEVERHKAPGGLPISLSRDPNCRAVGGGSTGAIAAFTVAWQRPDAFRRVFSSVGTYVGMRGGDGYPVLVRKTEPKPIRVFLEDGSNDQLDAMLGEVGNWWLGNQTMESALRFAGYEVAHAWGEGGHSDKHASMIFPDAMRWLWKDWERPIVAGTSSNILLKGVLLPNEPWQPVTGAYRSASSLAGRADGTVEFVDAVGKSRWTIDGRGQLRNEGPAGRRAEVLAFARDGTRFAADAGAVVALAPAGKATTVATGVRASGMLATGDKRLYLTDDTGGRLWLIAPGKDKVMLDSGLDHPSGIALSPDGHWLAVAERTSRWGYSYRVKADGSVDAKQKFYWFHVPDDSPDSGTGTLAMDRDGRLYAATRLGIQLLDRNGRSRAILPVPGGHAIDLAFGGTNFDTLYVICADGRVYRRKLGVSAMPTWTDRIALPPGFAG